MSTPVSNVPPKSLLQNTIGTANNLVSVVDIGGEALRVGAETFLDVMYVGKNNSSCWRDMSEDRTALKRYQSKQVHLAHLEELGISPDDLEDAGDK